MCGYVDTILGGCPTKQSVFLSPQDANADEFEDKEWTFVIEGVSISLCLTKTVYK